MIGQDSTRSETRETINQKIVKGVTTKAQVKAAFGEPSSTTSTAPGREEWTYNMSSSADGAMNIPVLGALFGGTAKSKTLAVDFDRRGVVSTYSLKEEQK